MGCFDHAPYAFPPGSRRAEWGGPFGSARDNADYERERAARERTQVPSDQEEVPDDVR